MNSIFIVLLLASFAQAGTLEEFNILIQATQNLEGLRKDMRQNAQAYKADISSGRLDTKKCAEIMKQDAFQYQRRLKWVSDIRSDSAKNQKLQNALGMIEASDQELANVILEMKNVADFVGAATLDTPEDINSVADSILSSVEDHDKVF